MTPRFRTTSCRPSPAPWKAFRDHRGHWLVHSRHGQFLASMATGFDQVDGPNARLMAAGRTLADLLRQIVVISESLDYEDGDDAGRLAAQEDALDRIRNLAYKGLRIAETR
jgi:hypothetical protein